MRVVSRTETKQSNAHVQNFHHYDVRTNAEMIKMFNKRNLLNESSSIGTPCHH